MSARVFCVTCAVLLAIAALDLAIGMACGRYLRKRSREPWSGFMTCIWISSIAILCAGCQLRRPPVDVVVGESV